VYKRVIDLTISFTDRLRFGWVKKCLWAFLAMQALWLLFFVLYPNWGNFTAKWWYFIGFSSIMYYIGFSGYINNEISLVPFRISGPDMNRLSLSDLLPIDDHTMVVLKEDPEPTTLDIVRNQNLDEWKQKIESVIYAGSLYRNAGLTLQMVAEQLGTNQTIISKMINQGFGMSFNDLINQYRTNAVIELLEKREYKQQTLLGISIDCGFNSKTTFNRCFKKYTGLTPRDYISNLENKNFQN
ncbi:MAG: AraC family transcriptional regulator, partial [Chitinophagaceae bacterium]